MATAFLVVLSVAVGFGVRRWWALLVPLSTGLVTAAVMSLRGYGLSDTPIPFVVVMATVAVAGGVVLRGRQRRAAVTRYRP